MLTLCRFFVQRSRDEEATISGRCWSTFVVCSGVSGASRSKGLCAGLGSLEAAAARSTGSLVTRPSFGRRRSGCRVRGSVGRGPTGRGANDNGGSRELFGSDRVLAEDRRCAA